jgi:hypothetical protein
MHEKSIMAPSYVPEQLRQINRLPVTAVLPTLQPRQMSEFVQKIYLDLVARVPICYCTSHAKPPWQNLPIIPVDPYFALSPAASERASPKFERTFPAIDTVSSREEYVNVFSLLLREEFDSTLVLYERYSQYGQRVIAWGGKKEKGKDKATNSSTATTAATTQHDRATLSIRGIHDARPALQSGDKVLIRPHQPMHPSFLPPGILNTTNPYHHPSVTSPSRVEIHATVVRTIRGTNKSPDQVVVTWLPGPQAHSLKKSQSAVRFLPNTTNYERCLTALNWLSTSIAPDVARDLLFPSKIPDVPPYETPSNEERLNAKQSQFVNMVLARTSHPSTDQVRPPMILTGPAGTGKTKALLVSILKTLALPSTTTATSNGPNSTTTIKRMLVCTPSPTACDVVARRLGKFLKSTQLFRLYDASRPVEMVPIDMLPYTCQGTQGEFVLPPVAELMQFQVIVCTCSDAHILYLAGLTNASLRSRRQCFQNYVEHGIQQSGLCISKGGTIMGASQPHFTHLFVDEAAQATEPETLIPMSVVVDDAPGVIKVEIALAGDPRQLSPSIYSPWAVGGLQKSLLERLLRLPDFGGRGHLLGPPTKNTWRTLDELIEYSFHKKEDEETTKQPEHLSVFLTTSYRGHPALLYMPSHLFYFDKLRSVHATDWEDASWCAKLRSLESQSTLAYPCQDKQYSWPIYFRGIKGKDTSVAVESCWGSNSWSNMQEARVVVESIQRLHSQGVSTQSIGVMAAFRAQVVLIRKLLRQQGLGSVNVGMVEDYQAVEWDVIILSLSRSSESFLQSDVDRGAGLFQQPKRVNVALTRCENLLLVIGNPATMRNDPIWSKWLDFCRQNGLWYGEKCSDNENDAKEMK